MKNLVLLISAAVLTNVASADFVQGRVRAVRQANLELVSGPHFPLGRTLSLNKMDGSLKPVSFTMVLDTGIRCIVAPFPSEVRVEFSIVKIAPGFHGDLVRYEAIEKLKNIPPNVRIAPRKLFVTESSMELVAAGGIPLIGRQPDRSLLLDVHACLIDRRSAAEGDNGILGDGFSHCVLDRRRSFRFRFRRRVLVRLRLSLVRLTLVGLILIALASALFSGLLSLRRIRAGLRLPSKIGNSGGRGQQRNQSGNSEVGNRARECYQARLPPSKSHEIKSDWKPTSILT